MRRFLTLLTAAVLFGLPARAGDFDPAAFVDAHNRWRAEAGVTEKLAYSAELARSAQAWADDLKKTHRCQARHSKSDGKYGENIFWASAVEWSDGRRDVQKVTPQQVVDGWGNEKADYDYARNSCTTGKVCGHYTQVVWRTTKTLGCGVAVCEDSREQVWVCQYQPPGNWVGRKPY